jgi:ABC-2 type transport system permease protein
MRYIHLLGVFIKASFQSETSYRFNFAANLLKTVLNIIGSIGGLAVVFYNSGDINGGGYDELAALLGVYLLVQGLKDLVIGPGLESLSGLSGELWTGQFDYTLLKPVPTQFYISFRKWSLWSLIDIAFAAVIIIISAAGVFPPETSPAPMHAAYFGQTGDFLIFIAALLISLALVYSVLLMLASAAFWYLGTPLMWIFDSLIQTGRYPVGIYPGFLRTVLTWVIPVGFKITVPAQALSGSPCIPQLAGGSGLAVVMFILAAAFFRSSLKKYSSASS